MRPRIQTASAAGIIYGCASTTELCAAAALITPAWLSERFAYVVHPHDGNGSRAKFEVNAGPNDVVFDCDIVGCSAAPESGGDRCGQCGFDIKEQILDSRSPILRECHFDSGTCGPARLRVR